MEKNSENTNKKKSWVSIIYKKNPLATVFGILIIILVLSAFIKIEFNTRSVTNENALLVQKQKLMTDSIKLNSIKQTTNVFSWAVRGELIRSNLDQIDQFFISLIKDPLIETVSLISPEKNMIILSSNKKLEKHIVTDSLFLYSKIVTSDSINGSLWVSCPIYGLDNKIGVIAIKVAN